MVSRIARLAALLLPLSLACVIAVAGLRLHDGRVERASHSESTATAAVTTAGPSDAPVVAQVFRHQLDVSVPWPAFAALLLLCVLPTIASVLAWSGTRRGRRTGLAVSRGAP